jgi:hypothetical protein
MEGVRTVSQTLPNDTDRNDAMSAWPRAVAEALGCEYGVVAFGGQGLTVGGTAATNVPVLTSSYNLIMQGVNRSFSSPAPDYIIEMMGANDFGHGSSAASVATAQATFLADLVAAAPSAKIFVLADFTNDYTSNLQSATAGFATAKFIGASSGFFNSAFGADSLNLHPTGANDVGMIAPQIATAILPNIAGGYGTSGGYRPGFH